MHCTKAGISIGCLSDPPFTSALDHCAKKLVVIKSPPTSSDIYKTLFLFSSRANRLISNIKQVAI